MKKNSHILYCLLTILIVMTALNTCIRQSVCTTLAEWEVGKAFVFRMNDVIDEYYGSEDTDKLVALQNEMLQEKGIQKITGIYMDYAINSTIKEATIQDTSKEIQNIVKESVSLIEKKLNVKTDQSFRQDLEEQCENGEQALHEYIDSSIEYAKQFRIPLIISSLFLMNIYRNLYIVLSVMLLTVTCYFSDRKIWMKEITKCFLIASICVVFFSVCGGGIGMYLSNHFLGRTQIYNKTPFLTTCCIMALLCVFLQFISKRLRS